MEKIIVIDKFLENSEIDILIKIINKKGWKFGQTSSNKINDFHNISFWKMNLDEEEYFSIYIKKIIEKTFNKKLKLITVYANGQTFGQDGHYHTDSDETNTFTFCLYLTKIKEDFLDNANGYLYFKFPNENKIICFEPLFNRGIFFPSNILHKGCAFSRLITDLRISIAWKFYEIENDN